MNNFKTAILAIAATAMLTTSCTQTTKNIKAFTDNEWYLDSTLVIKNDSAFSYAKYD